MIFISHRGNLNGRVPSEENTITKIKYVIQKGYDVEIDLWNGETDEIFYLGHDEPLELITIEELLKLKNNLWIHCKNFQALNILSKVYNDKLNFFWHEIDAFTLTSKNFIWTYPCRRVEKNSIMQCPENTYVKFNVENKNCYGICSDYIQKNRESLLI